MLNFTVEHAVMTTCIVITIASLFGLFSVIKRWGNVSQNHHNNMIEGRDSHEQKHLLLAFTLTFIPVLLFFMFIHGVLIAYAWEQAPLKKESIVKIENVNKEKNTGMISSKSLKNVSVDNIDHYQKTKIIKFKQIGEINKPVEELPAKDIK